MEKDHLNKNKTDKEHKMSQTSKRLNPCVCVCVCVCPAGVRLALLEGSQKPRTLLCWETEQNIHFIA